MKILITGAYGQLGRELEVQSGNFPNWKFLFTDADTLNITNEQSVAVYFQQNQVDFVINCAAYTAVDKAETDVEAAANVNALAPAILAKYAKICGAKIIHISTDYVFAGDASQPYTETDAVNPQGVYGETKLIGEKHCQRENPKSIIIRTSWLYSSFGSNFVKTMLRLGSEQEQVKVVFDQIGTPTYAADLAQVILQIVKSTERDSANFVPGIYHYSNQGVASWYDFAHAVFEISNKRGRALPVRSSQFPVKAKRPAYSVMDKSKICTTFGLEIRHWHDALTVFLDKYNANRHL